MNTPQRLEAELLNATKVGDQKKVTTLIEKYGVDINCSDDEGKTPLHTATKNHHSELVRYLLEKRADHRLACSSDRFTPLHEAVIACHLEAIVHLLKHKSSLTAKSVSGWTPIHYASCFVPIKPINGKHLYDECLATWMLQDRAALNTLSDANETPLHVAIKRWNKEQARNLLKAGAHIHIRNHEEFTPLDQAMDVYMEGPRRIEFDPLPLMIQELLRAGSTAKTIQNVLQLVEQILIDSPTDRGIKERAHHFLTLAFHQPVDKSILTLSDTTSFRVAEDNVAERLLVKRLLLNQPNVDLLKKLSSIKQDFMVFEKDYQQSVANFKKQYDLSADTSNKIAEDYFKIRGDADWVYSIKWLLIEGLAKISLNNSHLSKLPQEVMSTIWEFALSSNLTACGIQPKAASRLIETMVLAKIKKTLVNQLPSSITSPKDASPTLSGCHSGL